MAGTLTPTGFAILDGVGFPFGTERYFLETNTLWGPFPYEEAADFRHSSRRGSGLELHSIRRSACENGDDKTAATLWRGAPSSETRNSPPAALLNPKQLKKGFGVPQRLLGG